MATLSNEVKAFIVRGLADFEEPSKIIKDVELEFGIKVTPSQISFYNPKNSNSKRLGKEWVDLFNHCREQAMQDLSDIPIAHLPYRLKKLQGSLDKALKSGNLVLANDILKQAAEDIGGKYTNQSKVDSTSSDGSMTPVPTLTPDLAKAIAKDLDDEY